MGNWINSLPSADFEMKQRVPMTGYPLSKIRELHGNYKSVCDNFAINLQEFETIFESNQESFGIFDTDSNGLIDALEVFSGLIMFAGEERTSEKIRFLFDIFDFNDIQTISYLDLQFMVQSIVVASSKIYGFGADVQDQEIINMILQNFQEGARINYN